jgi:hypothetical protein
LETFVAYLKHLKSSKEDKKIVEQNYQTIKCDGAREVTRAREAAGSNTDSSKKLFKLFECCDY